MLDMILESCENEREEMNEGTAMAGGNNGQGMKWIRNEKRLAIYMRDGFSCLYCRRDLRGAQPGELTLDHLTPRSTGGSNEHTNLVTACRSCNSTRQAMPLERWMSNAAGEGLGVQMAMALQVYAGMTLINVKLAKAILNGEAGDPRVENADIEVNSDQ